jgi:16S rRNA processing protein RimM
MPAADRSTTDADPNTSPAPAECAAETRTPVRSDADTQTPARSSSEELLAAGRVGRAHGLDGSFYVTGAQPGLLALGTRVHVAGRIVEIVRHAGVEKRPIVRLHGVEDRAAAEALRGVALTVDRREAPPLGEGEWWAHELEGCAVLDVNGEQRLGTVSALRALPSCEVLEVRREDGGELLVPMVSDAIRHIDVARKRIEIDAGFLGETWR